MSPYRSLASFLESSRTAADDFTYLRGLAQGLVLAYAGRTDNEDNLRYIAVTSIEALDQAGVPIAGAISVLPDGKVVLAEAAVSAHV